MKIEIWYKIKLDKTSDIWVLLFVMLPFKITDFFKQEYAMFCKFLSQGISF